MRCRLLAGGARDPPAVERPCMDFASDPTRARRLRLAAGLAPWALCLALLGGCGSLPRHAPPPQLVLQGTIPHFPGVRGWAGQPSSALEKDLVASFAQESAEDFPPRPDGSVHYAHLALSGGGANGAFGSGFLNGWTLTGTRPVFKIVTGVSTGALMAPFAFIGADYDLALQQFYTTTSSSDIFQLRSMFGMLWQLLAGEALADTGPLQSMIQRHVDAELLRRVAQAHQRGRRLYMGTVNLDAPRFVVWNMGLIASSGHPDALALFRKVMLASASIPVAFPPVFFDVEAAPGGARYDEMHVDGGVGARVFLHGGVLTAQAIRQRGGLGGVGSEDIFVIHNGQLIAPPDPVQRSLAQIAARVIDATGRAATVGDLHRLHGWARGNDASFRWVTIPDDVLIEGGEQIFDPATMRTLYALGFEMGRSGQSWSTLPPGRREEPQP